MGGGLVTLHRLCIVFIFGGGVGLRRRHCRDAVCLPKDDGCSSSRIIMWFSVSHSTYATPVSSTPHAHVLALLTTVRPNGPCPCIPSYNHTPAYQYIRYANSDAHDIGHFSSAARPSNLPLSAFTVDYPCSSHTSSPGHGARSTESNSIDVLLLHSVLPFRSFGHPRATAVWAFPHPWACAWPAQSPEAALIPR